jgi:hypothetical protein
MTAYVLLNGAWCVGADPWQVMVLDQGRLKEFDRPATLLADSSSAFHSLCRATGRDEFAQLKKMAGV